MPALSLGIFVLPVCIQWPCKESSKPDEPRPKVYFGLKYSTVWNVKSFFRYICTALQRMTVSFSISGHLTVFRSRFLKQWYAIHCSLVEALVKTIEILIKTGNVGLTCIACLDLYFRCICTTIVAVEKQ
jgi:hypothetical protein